jgi:hypothetical protein
VQTSEIHVLCQMLGEVVSEIYRTHYLYQGRLDTREGELTLVFENGKTLRLSHTEHGQDLSVHTDRWVDPFVEPLDEANQRWVEEHGRPTEICVSTEEEWQPFVGLRLTAVGELTYRNWSGPVGVSLRMENERVLFVYNIGDEVTVRRRINREEIGERLVCSYPVER